jgi:hypothetical protein
MKYSSGISLIFLASLIAQFGVISVNSSTTTVDQQMLGGSLLIISVPSDLTFSVVAVDVGAQTSTASFASDSIQIQDMRSSASAFTFSVTSTDFVETSNASITFDLTNLKIKGDINGTITEVGTSDCQTGVTIGANTLTSFADTDNDGLSNGQSALSGDARARIMECHLEPNFSLNIPGATTAGTYVSTLTWSIS